MRNRKSVIQAFSLITQLGISMITPALLCTIAGMWLEEHTSIPLTIPFIILGILAGARNVYALVKQTGKMIADEKEED
jgi:ATP synthase protein I